MKSILKSLLFILIVALIFYGLFLYPGTIVISWFGYDIHTNIFAISIIALFIIMLVTVVKIWKRILFLLFNKINFNNTLSEYIQRIELASSFDKEIQLNLLNEIKNLRTLKLFSYLNSLMYKQNFNKVLKVIKKKEGKNKLESIIAYFKVEVHLIKGEIQEAINLCKFYLSSKKNMSWAFLKLLNISLKNNNNEHFEFLNNLLINRKVSLIETVVEQVVCLINYKLAEQEFCSNNDNISKRLNFLIKKYPNFIPAYSLLIKYLSSASKNEEAINILFLSWSYSVTYENSILLDSLFIIENKDVLIKEINNLYKSSKENNKNNLSILKLIVFTAYNDFISAQDSLVNIKSKNTSFFKLANLYEVVNEYNIKEGKEIIVDFANSLFLNWWNEYLKINSKP